ncbi:MAG: CAP domain-containing protein [Hapalosiphonaceae cyanobacterium JJU2]|nr:MAG: CAP domain-containing protein [Hapalosiphonaceae cyanobacterium JJU2]
MLKTAISSIFIGAFTLSSGVMAISKPSQTDISKHWLHSQLPHHTIKLTASTIDTAVIEDSVFQQINDYRTSQGLPALTRNVASDEQARTHSRNMANGTVPFDHSGYEQRIQSIGITYRSAAENIAYNQGYSDPATQAVQSWLGSPEHLANIKNNYNFTGVGVASNSQGEIYFTQIFLRTR